MLRTLEAPVIINASVRRIRQLHDSKAMPLVYTYATGAGTTYLSLVDAGTK